jgi:nucleoid DNA-binding protein
MPYPYEDESATASPNAHKLRKKKEKSSTTLTRKAITVAIMRRMPNLSRQEAARILDSVLKEIVDVLMQREGSVKLHEFGTFYVSEKTTRKGRNPLSGRNASLPRRKSLKFRPSRALKEKVERNGRQERPPRS